MNRVLPSILACALLTGCSASWFAHPLGGKASTPERQVHWNALPEPRAELQDNVRLKRLVPLPDPARLGSWELGVGSLATQLRSSNSQLAVIAPRTGYVNRLAWAQPDWCIGWEVVCQTNGVTVTNIARPFVGHEWTNTIYSPYGGFHEVKTYRR